MAIGSRLRASALGAVLVLGATFAPASAATGDLPDLGPNVTVGRLPAGGTVIVDPAQGAPVAAVELWYRAPSTGFGPKPLPALARLAAQAVAASKPIVGDPLGKVVADAGGRLAITVYSDSISISAVVPAAAARSIVKTMTTAFFAPVATEDGFHQAQRDVEQESLISNYDAETVVRDAVFAQLFSDGPQHYPALGAPKDVSAIAFADVKSFATRAFRSQNATLVVSGAIDSGIAAAAVPGRPAQNDDATPEPPAVGTLAASIEPVTKAFVEASGGYGWAGPPIADAREATAMDFIADYLFRGDVGTVVKRAAATQPQALVVGQFITLHDPGVMFVEFSGKDAAALRALVDDGFASVRKPMDPPAFANALASFKYHLLSDLQTPAEKADNFGWYSVEGAADYAPGASGEAGRYFQAADSLTPEFVASVAEKYLGKTPVVVTLRPESPKGKAKPE
jgi:predicted Zn-dependent peptidase